VHKRNIDLKEEVAKGQQDKVDKVSAFGKYMKGLTADFEMIFYLLELEKKRIEEKYTPLIQ